MVGTPESSRFFESAIQLARRSVGLQYTTMSYDKYFQEFCKVMFRYQYVQKRTEITDGIIAWLYEHSAGITSVVVALIHDAQEIAILNSKETLNLELLNEAYQQRLSLLHGYIQPSISRGKHTSKIKKKAPVSTAIVVQSEVSDDRSSITELVAKAKNESIDIVKLLKSNMSVVEVAI